MRDLLEGEQSNAASLDNYLDFSFDAATSTTTVNVSSQGNGVVDHQIQLQNFDATTLGASDLEIITSLLDKGKLLSDA